MGFRSRIHARLRAYSLALLTLIVLILPACRREATFQDNYDAALQNIATGKYDIAQIQLQRALKQNPESFETQYQLAIVALKLHDDVSAYNILRPR